MFFILEFENITAVFEIGTINLVKMQTVLPKEKVLNLGIKMSYVDNFGTEFEKTIVIFKIRTMKFAYTQSFI